MQWHSTSSLQFWHQVSFCCTKETTELTPPSVIRPHNTTMGLPVSIKGAYPDIGGCKRLREQRYLHPYRDYHWVRSHHRRSGTSLATQPLTARFLSPTFGDSTYSQ